MRQFKPDGERDIPWHPSPKTFSFYLAVTYNSPASGVATLVTLLQTQFGHEIAHVLNAVAF